MMDLATLLLACSVHADDALLAAVAYAHSSAGNVYSVQNVHLDVLTSQDEPLWRGTPPRSIDAALSEIARIADAGGTPVVGLLPVRLEWAAAFGKTPAQILEPCTNVAVASAQVSAFDYECRSEGPRATSPARRACTLNRYGSSVGLPGLPRSVLANLSTGGLDAAPLLAFEIPAAAEPVSTLFFALEPLEKAPAIEFAHPVHPSLPPPVPADRRGSPPQAPAGQVLEKERPRETRHAN